MRPHPLASMRFFQRYNENHDPDTGQFASGDGGGSGGGGKEPIYSDVGSKTGTKDHVEKTGKSGSGAGKGGKGGGTGKSLSGGSHGEQPRPYQGGSPGNDRGDGRLKGATIKQVFSPTEDHPLTGSDHAAPLTFNELGEGGAAVFHSLISEAKSSNKFGAAVTLYPEEDYGKGMRLFTTDDGNVGFALKGDDIVSVFKNDASKAKDIVGSILPLAVQEGGRRLDCFDTVLPTIYGANGFKAVARTPFDENYQPDGWDKKTFSAFNGGKPDVVFMVADKDAAPYKRGDGKTYASYDEGMAAQEDAVAASKKSKRAFDPVSFYMRSLFDPEKEN